MTEDTDRLRIRINLGHRTIEKLEQQIREDKKELLRLLTLCPVCGADLNSINHVKE